MFLEGLQWGRKQIAANPFQSKSTFDTLDAGGNMRLADAIEIAHSDDQRAESLDADEVSVMGSLVEPDEKLREDIGPAVDAAIGAAWMA